MKSMEKKVYKYKLESTVLKQTVLMPHNMKILSFQYQGDEPYIWILVDVESDNDWEYEFRIVLTGQKFEGFGWSYVGTAQRGYFVGHLFFHGNI